MHREVAGSRPAGCMWRLEGAIYKGCIFMDNLWTRVSSFVSWYLTALSICAAFNYFTGLARTPSAHVAEIGSGTRILEFGRGRRLNVSSE